MTAQQVRQLLLNQGGFLNNKGEAGPGLVDATHVHQQVDSHLRYHSLFQAMEPDTAIPDLIYESPPVGGLPSTPCGYLKTLADPSASQVAALRTKLWNHGRIPTLWVITPQSVLIYDAFARPREQDTSDYTNHLLGELRLIGDQLTDLHRFHRRNLDDGSFWREGPGKDIDPRQRVDQSLLQDLQATDSLLRSEGLPSAEAHSILRATVFVQYLEDRKLLQTEHFRYFSDASSFQDILTNEQTTRDFFAWLHATFNGDLFPPSHPGYESLKETHLDILRRFLTGHAMHSYPNTQASFWPYSFEMIPIELISSIYEMFAHADDPDTARARSVHYTRLGLVELTLSLAMEGLPDSAKILDPACGSGVFLVEAFRRLAWARSAQLGRQLTRPELHDLLRSQIFGIDIDRDAVYVAAFSLYLALLELDPDPHPPNALRFPYLLQGGPDAYAQNLYVQDFFNLHHGFNLSIPFVNQDFSLVVSNPPWTAWKESTAPPDPDEPEEAIQWGLKYVQENAIPDRKPDQAFIQHARQFANPQTRIAMVVGSRLFYQDSPPGKRWRERFFYNNTVHFIVDLSDLANAKLLFGSKSSPRLPAAVVVFSPTSPAEDSTLQYIAPKRYPGLRSRDEILLTSSDVQSLPQRLVSEPHFPWKAAFRGTPRDIRLLDRLHNFQPLDLALDKIGIVTGVDRGRGLTLGRGLKKDAVRFQGLRYLPGDAPKQRYTIDPRALPFFNETEIARRSNQFVLRLPAVVLARSLSRNKPSVSFVEKYEDIESIALAQTYYGISFRRVQHFFANRLNAVLNSELTLYWIFMTAVELGVGRRLIEIGDWHKVPLPESIFDAQSTEWDQILEYERQLRQNANDTAEAAELQAALDQEVYSLYELSLQEKVTIQDAVRYVIDPYLEGVQIGEAVRPSQVDLVTYAQRVCSQLNGLLRHIGRVLSATVFVLSDEIPLTACRFRMHQLDSDSIVTEEQHEAFEPILSAMSEHLREEVTNRLYVHRDLRVYEEDGFWIIKPSDIRLWTQTAALNDADLIVNEHLGMI